MSQMKELYEKVAKDADLQNQFTQILQETEAAGQEATGEMLVSFAKDAGFDISIQEMKQFFTEFTAKLDGELSDMELDMVAGGKSQNGTINVVGSAVTLGFWCAIVSLGGGTGDGVYRRPSCEQEFQ